LNLPDAFPFPHTQPLPPELAQALAQAAARLGSFVRQVQWYRELSSTNDLAAAYAERGAREGSVIIAGSQAAGRGRQGRTWQSPPGAGLYVSIVLRPEPKVVPLLTIAAGVALADGIRAATGLETALKWPNDVYVAHPRSGAPTPDVGASIPDPGSRSQDPGSPPIGHKVAGILAEVGASALGATHVVLGFGINVRRAALPPDVAGRATSLEAELGRAIDPGVVLVECLAALAARYDDLKNDRIGAVLHAWRAYARPLLGRAVEWDDRGTGVSGVAEDVDGTGALVVRTAAGTRRVVSGEVRWI
jgi:BirA family biotin operon repressor/biotin-[acetyl-CoA-carboxylase] ligase